MTWLGENIQPWPRGAMAAYSELVISCEKIGWHKQSNPMFDLSWMNFLSTYHPCSVPGVSKSSAPLLEHLVEKVADGATCFKVLSDEKSNQKKVSSTSYFFWWPRAQLSRTDPKPRLLRNLWLNISKPWQRSWGSGQSWLCTCQLEAWGVKLKMHRGNTIVLSKDMGLLWS